MAILVLALSIPAPSIRGQENQVQPEPEADLRPYVPPPAWKSVEIADFYLKRKKYRAALSRYQEAAKVDPYYAPAYLGLGKVYDRFGFKEKALQAYRRYLDLLPSAKEAEEARDVHKAIARLERRLQRSKPSSQSRASPAETDRLNELLERSRLPARR